MTLANPKFTFGNKAETLYSLKDRVTTCTIPRFVFFKVSSWEVDQEKCLNQIKTHLGNKVIVRSSAFYEDQEDGTSAGKYLSIPHTQNIRNDLKRSIEAVIQSYSQHPDNVVLVQDMVDNVVVSGVITSKDLRDGAPYYVFNYDDESGQTDSITQGKCISKTLRIFRSAPFHGLKSKRVASWLEMTKEIESLCQSDQVDIEFAQDQNGTCFLFQVRPLYWKNWHIQTQEKVLRAHDHLKSFFSQLNQPSQGLFGHKTALGVMPDWNPAEIIGLTPSPLARSLYRYLITDRVWHESRADMGYHRLISAPLMVEIGGRPFIDVRKSFNSFLPLEIDKDIANKLVNTWVQHLKEHPEHHDKIEFEVATTVLDFNFDQVYDQKYPNILNKRQCSEYKFQLRNLTQALLDPKTILFPALNRLKNLPAKTRKLSENPMEILGNCHHDLKLCQLYGTYPFAQLARLGFVAEAILKSAVQRGAITEHRISQLKRSVSTVLKELSRDFALAMRNKTETESFLEKYGHLRPGTYDICSKRYDQRPDLFSEGTNGFAPEATPEFHWTSQESQNLEKLLSESELNITPNQVLDFSRKAIEAREFAKFEFTKTLSNVLENLAKWGELLGFSRSDVSQLSIQQIIEYIQNPPPEPLEMWFGKLIERAKEDMHLARGLRLGYLICDPMDFDIIPMHRTEPTFITQSEVSAKPIYLSGNDTDHGLKEKIVCISHADPGFDWIFTREVAGLITQFGGANSHMAIRCAEIGLPAVIGCGEVIFSRLSENQIVTIDGLNRKIINNLPEEDL